MELYKLATSQVEFSGPTHFASIIKHAIEKSKQILQLGHLEYNILLIITDGEIHDMESTI